MSHTLHVPPKFVGPFGLDQLCRARGCCGGVFQVPVGGKRDERLVVRVGVGVEVAVAVSTAWKNVFRRSRVEGRFEGEVGGLLF